MTCCRLTTRFVCPCAAVCVLLCVGEDVSVPAEMFCVDETQHEELQTFSRTVQVLRWKVTCRWLANIHEPTVLLLVSWYAPPTPTPLPGGACCVCLGAQGRPTWVEQPPEDSHVWQKQPHAPRKPFIPIKSISNRLKNCLQQSTLLIRLLCLCFDSFKNNYFSSFNHFN